MNRARWEYDLKAEQDKEKGRKTKEGFVHHKAEKSNPGFSAEKEKDTRRNKEMTDTMNLNVGALKKQLAAAIAMVCVAAVALGSSTYAWFVSNNTVTATTTTISAQSNAPFLKITSGTRNNHRINWNILFLWCWR